MSPTRAMARAARTLTVGPFIGMRDTIDPGASVPTHASLLQNVYPVDPLIPSAIVGRPGVTCSAPSAAGSGAVQYVGQFTKLNGTELTIAIVAGRFYAINWTTRVWTEVLTAADFAGASIALSPTARCAAVTLNDKLVVSDGVNTPWMWDGTSHGGLTKLTACPVLYGPPTVYAAKVVGIKASDRSTIVWSEEDDPTLGYDTTPATYPNYWQLAQTDQNRLTAVVGTNTSLVYFREQSIGAVHGQISKNFVNDATHDGVSANIGTTSPYAVLLRNQSIYFLDINGRPHVMEPGQGLTPLWADVVETLRTIPRSALGNASAVDYPETGLVLFAVAEAGYTTPNLVLAYNPVAIEGGAPPCVALWRGWSITVAGLVKNGAGVPTVLHGDATGYCYDHANPEDNVWSDGGPGGAQTAIQHIVLTPAIGYSPRESVSWTRADFAFRLPGALTGLQFSYVTPRGESTPITGVSAGNFATYGNAVYDAATYAVDAAEAKIAVGIQANQCRWIKFKVAHAVAGESFGFMQLTLEGTPASRAPSLT